jgi:hypothetical protein
VLVFLGLVIASYQNLSPSAAKAVKARAKRPAPFALAIFGLSIVIVGMCLCWLTAADAGVIYQIIVWAFAIELLAVFALAAVMTWKMLD